MDSIGHILKTTRERKRISQSYAAAQTRIKIQYLEWMERDDFSHMPAPAYAKGFLRMYAEFLGLDPHPLVQQYVDVHLGHRPPRLSSAVGSGSRPPAAPPPPRPEPAVPDPAPAATAVETPHAPGPTPAPAPIRPRRSLPRPDFNRLKTAVASWPWRVILTVVVSVVTVVLLANGLARCARRAESQPVTTRPAVFKKGVPAVIQDVPEPYLPLPAEPMEKQP